MISDALVGLAQTVRNLRSNSLGDDSVVQHVVAGYVTLRSVIRSGGCGTETMPIRVVKTAEKERTRLGDRSIAGTEPKKFVNSGNVTHEGISIITGRRGMR
jgi:hypothetical protein